MKRHLIVYARRPLPDYAKTRLGADIGAEQAAGAYARLLYGYLLDLLSADLADTCIELAVATPADAVARGATWLVVGRPIIAADDPVAAAQAIVSDMDAA